LELSSLYIQDALLAQLQTRGVRNGLYTTLYHESYAVLAMPKIRGHTTAVCF
jgi:hypothetical protein